MQEERYMTHVKRKRWKGGEVIKVLQCKAIEQGRNGLLNGQYRTLRHNITRRRILLGSFVVVQSQAMWVRRMQPYHLFPNILKVDAMVPRGGHKPKQDRRGKPRLKGTRWTLQTQSMRQALQGWVEGMERVEKEAVEGAAAKALEGADDNNWVEPTASYR